MAGSKRTRTKSRYSAPTRELERKVHNRIANVAKKYGVELNFDFRDRSVLKGKALDNYRRNLLRFINSNATKFKAVKNEQETFYVPLDEYNRFNKAVRVANKNRSKTKSSVEKMLKPPEFMKKSKIKTDSIIDAMRGVLQEPKMEFLQPLSHSLSMVHSLDEFRQRLASFEKRADANYIADRISMMKENYIKAILNQENGLVGGGNDDTVSSIIDRLNKMSNDDFYAMYLSDEDLDFTYIYNEEDKQYMVNKISAAIDQADKGIFNQQS
jgi:hypothetical protein